MSEFNSMVEVSDRPSYSEAVHTAHYTLRRIRRAAVDRIIDPESMQLKAVEILKKFGLLNEGNEFDDEGRQKLRNFVQESNLILPDCTPLYTQGNEVSYFLYGFAGSARRLGHVEEFKKKGAEFILSPLSSAPMGLSVIVAKELMEVKVVAVSADYKEVFIPTIQMGTKVALFEDNPGKTLQAIRDNLVTRGIEVVDGVYPTWS